MIKELKPCPFCGGKARMLGGPMAQESYSVWCENRHHITGGMDADKLAMEWNTRYTPKGFTIVPVEPTDEMIQAGLRADNDSFPLQYIYKAMIDSVKECV
jgi:hypothetical protein